MASVVQQKLKQIKSKSPRVLTEKYQQVFDQLVAETSDPQHLQEGMEAFLMAGVCLSLSVCLSLCVYV